MKTREFGALSVSALIAAAGFATTVNAQVTTPNIPVGDIIISEIFYNPAGDESQSEFVELYNTTNNTTFDLAGMSISDIQDAGLQLGDAFPSYLLAPGEAVILVDPTEFEDDEFVRIGSPDAPVTRIDILIPSPTDMIGHPQGFTEADYAEWMGSQVLGRILFIEDLAAQANSGSASNETPEIANIPRGNSQFGPPITGDQFTIDIANYQNAAGGWPDTTIFPGGFRQGFGGQSILVRGGALSFIENDIGFNWVAAGSASFDEINFTNPFDDPDAGIRQGMEVIIPYRVSKAVDRVTGTDFNDTNDNFVQDSSDENDLYIFDPNGMPVFDDQTGEPIFIYRVFDGTRFVQETEMVMLGGEMVEAPRFDANGRPVYVMQDGERVDAGTGVREVASPGVVDTRLLFDNDCNDNQIIDAIELTDGLDKDENFNGVLDSCEIDAAGGSSGQGGPLDQDDNGRLDSVEIQLNPELDCDLNGTFDFVDIQGGAAADSNGRLVACQANTVVITELMYDPQNLDQFGAPTTTELEWIEITNISNGSVDVSGWRIVEIEDLTVDFPNEADPDYSPLPANTILAAGESLVIHGSLGRDSQIEQTAAEAFLEIWGEGVNSVEIENFEGLGNGSQSQQFSEIMAIADAEGDIVDVVNYVGTDSSGNPSLGWPGNNDQSSIYLVATAFNATDVAAANNDGSNWTLSIAGLDEAYLSNLEADTFLTEQEFGNIGSPGGANLTGVAESPVGDIIITELAYATNGVSNQSFEITPATANSPAIKTDNIVRTPTNEGFVNAKDDFVEIYNTTNQPIDLSGAYLLDEDGRTGAFPAGTILDPNEAAVIIGIPETTVITNPDARINNFFGENPAPLTNLYSAYPGDYQIILVSDFYTQNNGFFGFEGLADQSDATITFNFPINLSPSGVREVIQLIDGNGNVQDIVNFDDAQPWPFAQAGIPNQDTSSIFLSSGSLSESANDFGGNWNQSSSGASPTQTADNDTTRVNDFTLDNTPLTTSPETLIANDMFDVLNPVYNGVFYYASPGLVPSVNTVSGLGASPVIPLGACCVVTECFDGAEEDACDIVNGVWTNGASCDSNPCTQICLGDANGDELVDVQDFIAVLLNFGNDGPLGDANFDSVVDVNDFIAVLLNFGQCNPI